MDFKVLIKVKSFSAIKKEEVKCAKKKKLPAAREVQVKFMYKN